MSLTKQNLAVRGGSIKTKPKKPRKPSKSVQRTIAKLKAKKVRPWFISKPTMRQPGHNELYWKLKSNSPAGGSFSTPKELVPQKVPKGWKVIAETKPTVHICVPYLHSSHTLAHRLRCACTERDWNVADDHKTKLITLVNSQETVVAPPDQKFLARMALVTKTMWRPGRILTIGFLDGTPIQRKRVKSHAIKWLRYANLKFSWARTRHATANIRISFKEEGSWSTIGTDALTVPVSQPTMNYGWIRDDTDDAEYERVVIHEFGHALGCIHEHQNPSGGIKWDKEAVYRYFTGPPNNWSREDVDWNLFSKFDTNQTQFTQLDPLSIMAYSFPASFTLDGFSIPWNTTLSPTDIKFIQEEYPR